MATYKTHNPHFELIAYKEGLKRDEIALHSLCSEFLYSTEWFHNDQKVIDIFNSYTSIIETLWEEVKQDINNVINKWIELLKEDFDTHIMSLGGFKWPMFSKNISKFFHDIRHLKLSEEQYFYKTFYCDYIEAHNIDNNRLEYVRILHRVQLLLRLFKHGHIQKDLFQYWTGLSYNIYNDTLENMHNKTKRVVANAKEQYELCKQELIESQRLLEEFESSLPEYKEEGKKYFDKIKVLAV